MTTDRDEHSILVILDSGDASIDRRAIASLQGSQVTVLSFTQSNAAIDEVLDILSPLNDVHVESGAPSVDEVAPLVTERFLDLLARVPREFKLRGKPLKSAWEFDTGASLWWLHELSGRRSDIYPAFTRLCQLEVIHRALQRTRATRVVLVSPDRAFTEVTDSLCQSLGVEFQRAVATLTNVGLSYQGVVIRLALWSARTVGQTMLAKLLTRDTRPVLVDGTPLCCFHTLYPAFFISTSGAMDEKFHHVPNQVASHGVTPFVAVTFAADDGHQHMTMLAYLKATLMIRRRPSFNGVSARLIDRDLSWREMLRGIVNGAVVFARHAALERSPLFRDHWRMGDVDIFPLIQPELRMAAYRTPRYLMHLRRMQASVDVIKPDAMVSSLFEFCYGRATSYAIANSRTNPLNIGVQHGPTGRKLMYRFGTGEIAASAEARGLEHVPMPDHLILESEEARVALSSSGYPIERLHVLGAPRLDSLSAVPRWRGPKGKESGPIRVLVIFGGSDGAQIMGMVRPVVESRSEYHFIMKPHPRSSVQADQINAFFSGALSSSYEIASDDIYGLMATADVVLATYSSAGMEAAALGYPVVVLNLPNFVSPSGLLDLSGNVRFAASPEALIESLVAAESTDMPGANEIEKRFFSRLDGKSQERWAEVIARLTHEHVLG